jgi:hypothetical protein
MISLADRLTDNMGAAGKAMVAEDVMRMAAMPVSVVPDVPANVLRATAEEVLSDGTLEGGAGWTVIVNVAPVTGTVENATVPDGTSSVDGNANACAGVVSAAKSIAVVGAVGGVVFALGPH